MLVFSVVWVGMQGQRPAASLSASGLHRPPTQFAVRVTIADGVLISDGSVSNENGDAPRPEMFVVDTAATTTIVDPEVAQTLGGKGAAGEQLHDKTLRLAGAEVTRRPVSVFSLNAWSRQTGQPISGIAGSDIFHHFDARIDYVHQLLTLVVPQSCAVAGERIHLHMLGGLPFLDAEIQTAGGKRVRGLFLLDTGQSGPGLVLTSEFVAAHPEIAGKQSLPELPLLDPTGVVRDTVLVRIPALQIGSHALQGVIATIAPPAAGGAGAQLAGVIGGGVLAHFDVLVDLPHASLTLTPNVQYTAPFEADMSGMLVVATGIEGEPGERSGERAYTIAGISKNSPAADAGLQASDRLVEIGDRRVTDMSLDLVRSVLKSGTGTKLQVIIDRSGKRVRVTLTLRRAV
jgi:hypothetical protein